MPIPITIPRLGWNMEQGVFVAWLKPDGAAIRAGDPLFTLESEKSTEDIEALDAGVLHIPATGPENGETLAVGATIGFVLQAGEAAPSLAPSQAATPVPVAQATTPQPKSDTPVSTSRRAASPRARRAAAERGVDLSRLHGTGRGGRIRERDVLATAAPPSIRRIIADRMLASHHATAPVTLTTTADGTNLVNLRSQFKAAAEVGGSAVPSYTDFLIKLAAAALKNHPHLNARWDNGRVVLSDAIHIGVAVDSDAGLLVLVVRDVPSRTIKDLPGHTRDLIDRARRQQLKSSELQGSTFTITSLGSLGIDAFTPIINFPECAILGVGRIRKLAVVVGEQIVPREQMTLSLTFDHRIVDGAPAARFLQMLVGLIENPGPWLM